MLYIASKNLSINGLRIKSVNAKRAVNKLKKLTIFCRSVRINLLGLRHPVSAKSEKLAQNHFINHRPSFFEAGIAIKLQRQLIFYIQNNNMKKILLLVLFFPILGSYSQKWEKNYDFVDDCICGLAKVKKEGKIGYVNKDGVEIIKPQYDEGLTFHEGLTAVRKGSKWQYIDSTGKSISNGQFDDAFNFSEGLAAVGRNNKFGFINTKGDMVIDFEFTNASGFSEGLAAAANAQGLWGYIDTKGNWKIKPLYSFANNFDKGQARVMKGDKILYIDKDNKTVQE